MRLGIIGCGKVTTMFHLKTIGEVDVVEVTAVADPNEKRMEDVRRKAGAPRGYLDYRELLSDQGVDAVAVNAPPRFHEAMTLDAVRAGKHVLCEKPLARSVEGCRHIQEAQTGTGLVVHPVHHPRMLLPRPRDDLGCCAVDQAKVRVIADNRRLCPARRDIGQGLFLVVCDLLPPAVEDAPAASAAAPAAGHHGYNRHPCG